MSSMNEETSTKILEKIEVTINDYNQMKEWYKTDTARIKVETITTAITAHCKQLLISAYNNNY